jgi:hypothetical protein
LGDRHILSEILRWQQQENIVAMHNSRNVECRYKTLHS